MPTEQTQIIKRSICIRAKYRVREGKQKYIPSLVVPHPVNRGGDPIAPTRTRQLSGDIADDGYDGIEANTNGCVVQQKPLSNSFQEAFSIKLMADHDIAEFGVQRSLPVSLTAISIAPSGI